MNIRHFGIAVCLFAMPTSAMAESDIRIDPGKIDAIFADFDSAKSPGCAVGIIRDQKLQFAKGYGVADLNWGAPITPTTNFYLGSVGKQFTAAAMALAARQGHLSLDDPIQQWVPEIPEYERPITLRMLIHHTSGMKDYFELIASEGGTLDQPRTEAEILELIARQDEGNFPPGERYSYSNTGYFLLSIVLQRATGKTLRNYADEYFFKPLGMERTRFNDNRREIMSERAIGYSRSASGITIDSLENFDSVGSGGVYSNILDLVAWDRNFYTEEVGGEGFTERLLTPGTLSDGTEIPYAYGQFLGEHRGRRTVFHSGALASYRAMFMRFPDEKLSLITLCNTVVDSRSLAEKLADSLFE